MGLVFSDQTGQSGLHLIIVSETKLPMCKKIIDQSYFFFMLHLTTFHVALTVAGMFVDLRDDKQFFIDHPGASLISITQVKYGS